MPKFLLPKIILSVFILINCIHRAEALSDVKSIELSDLMKLMEEADEEAVEDLGYASVSVTVDFANGYVFRGTTFDQFVVQPGIEVWGLGFPEKYGHVNVGVWGNIDINDDENASGNFDFSEIDWYGTYYPPEFVDNLYLFIGFIEYTYPAVDNPANTEIKVGIEYWVEKLVLGTTAYVGVGGDTRGENYYDLSASYFLLYSPKVSASVGALAGYYDPDTGPSGWNEGVVDVAVEVPLGEVWSIGGSLAYVIQLDDSLFADAQDGETDGDYLFGMLSFRCVY